MTVTIELLLSLGGALIMILGFWWGIARWIIAEFGKRDLAVQAVDARAKLAEEEVRKSLEAHKLHAAETFATTHELANALGRVEASIERLADRLDKLLLEKGKKDQ